MTQTTTTQTTTTGLPQTGTWKIDPAHTVIGFKVRHLMAARVRGTFKEFDGTIHIGDRPEDSSMEVTIDASSIDTGVEDRDQHLRSADFLGAETHPELTFRSTGIRHLGGERFDVDGELTIRDLTHPITLSVTYLGTTKDPWGQDKAMATAETEIDRERWGLTWNQPLEAGGWLVGKKVELELEVQATRA